MARVVLPSLMAMMIMTVGGLEGPPSSTISPYWVSGPDSYMVLSGDIDVHYGVPVTAPALRMQLVEVVEGYEQPLVKKDVPRNTTSGKIWFPCGLVERAGQIAFRLVTVDENKVLARTDAIDVRWPLVTVHVPLVFETYTSDVDVDLHLGTLRCGPRPKSNYLTYVDLFYEGPTLSRTEEVSSWHEPSLIMSKELVHWLSDTSYKVIFECELFDKAGYYKVRVRTTVKTAPLVAESDTIHVGWSHRYSVSVSRATVDPCEGTLTVVYHYPRCSQDNDRIRIYGRTSSASTLKYVAEAKIQTGRHSSKISCNLFDSEYKEFCFTFVSTARNGAVFEQDTQCVPRTFDPGGVHADWGEWSAWSKCSSTCGPGVHSRFRFCSSSKASSECEGKSVQTQMCNLQSCPDSTTHVADESEYFPPDCLCGCWVNITERIVMKLTPTDCEQPPTWIITASSSGFVTMDIQNIEFPSPDHWLILRDGATPIGTILAMFSESDDLHPVHSTGGVMRLEIHSSNVTLVHTLSMKAVLKRSEQQERLALTQKMVVKGSASLSAVHVTMILLACVLCSATVVLLLLHQFRCLKRRTKYVIRTSSPCSLSHADGESCPNQHLLAASTSTSELSGSSPLAEHPDRCSLPKTASPSYSPEDFLHNSFLFRSVNSLCDSQEASSVHVAFTPPARRQALAKKLRATPVATVSPQPKLKWDKRDTLPVTKPLKSALKQRQPPVETNSTSGTKSSDSVSPLRRRTRPQGRATRQVQRESVTPLTASVSELSITGSEDGFEYDYYDYGCHDEPGSFFCPDAVLLGWPPFIPVPPDNIDECTDYPLQHFTPSPSQSENEARSTVS